MVRFSGADGTICLRRDRHGTIWSVGGNPSKLWRNSGTGFEPLRYPEGKTGPVISVAFDSSDSLWITTAIGGTYRFSHGEWSRQNEALGKKPGTIGAMAGDDAGNVWFGFSNYVVRWDGSKYSKFSFPDGTRGVSESTMSVRGDHVWLGGPGGIELFSQGHFYLMTWKDKELPGRVSGVIETETGDLWANGSSGITHVWPAELARWLRDPMSAISAEHFDARDGLPGFSVERIPEPSIAESSDHRLWFATTRGIAWLNPAKLQENRNRLPPPVIISSVSSNGKTYVGSQNLTLPAHTEKLEIDYTALSLAVPERVLFRYMLDGVDKEWQDAGTRRQAFYNSLSPRRYTFRVIACNNDGIWNEAGASLDFFVAPAYYQTAWFRSLCVVTLLLGLWSLLRLRLRRQAAQFSMRLEERVSERTHIARELHDTLLQSVQGLILKFDAGVKKLSRQEPVRHELETALDYADEVLAEGRDRVRSLRSGTIEVGGLPKAFQRVVEEAAPDRASTFKTVVEGRVLELHPIIREESFSIGREAILNALMHSEGLQIEVELTYDPREFQLRIRDNGRGMDPEVLQNGGRKNHFGLPGMRERARKIGGKLEVWSRPHAGTEVQLKIPAATAYRALRAEAEHS